MPRTPNDKLSLGKEYISKLSPAHQCKSFHAGFTKCNCIVKVQEQLNDVKRFFEEEIDEFWKDPKHHSNRIDADAIGHYLGVYLFSKCTFTSDLATYVFEIEGKDMEFCMPTIVRIFGLNQDAMTAARKVLFDRKTIGLTLLKKACWIDIKSDQMYQKIYWTYKNWFSHQVVPMGPNNKAAATLLKKLQGLMVVLDESSMKSIDHIHAFHSPQLSELNNVSNGGDNIKFASPGNGLPAWGSFGKKRLLLPFINQVKPALLDHWKNNKHVQFSYETSFLFSQVSATRDNFPQKAHQDLDSEVIKNEFDALGIKSMIGFTPISEDGMMIVVWTDGKPKKYRNKNQILEDHKRLNKNLYVTPGQYFIYIPRGVFIALPGDTIHAGGFCFGKKEPLPSPPNKTKKSVTTDNEHLFQNHCLHFSLLCSDLAYKVATGQETNITLVGDNNGNLYKDFLADEGVMDTLFKCLLDRHPNFVPPEAKKKHGKKQAKNQAKNKAKIPKGHTVSLKKK